MIQMNSSESKTDSREPQALYLEKDAPVIWELWRHHQAPGAALHSLELSGSLGMNRTVRGTHQGGVQNWWATSAQILLKQPFLTCINRDADAYIIHKFKNDGYNEGHHH